MSDVLDWWSACRCEWCGGMNAGHRLGCSCNPDWDSQRMTYGYYLAFDDGFWLQLDALTLEAMATLIKETNDER